MGDAVDGDLSFLHSFEEGGLGAGRGAVDFVHQHHVGHDGAWTEAEFPVALVEDVGAGDVGGEKVGGALDALEGAAEGEGDALGEDGFADAGNAVDEDVALAEEGHDAEAEGLLVADDDFLEVLEEGVGDFAGVGEGEFLHGGVFSPWGLRGSRWGNFNGSFGGGQAGGTPSPISPPSQPSPVKGEGVRVDSRLRGNDGGGCGNDGGEAGMTRGGCGNDGGGGGNDGGSCGNDERG